MNQIQKVYKDFLICNSLIFNNSNRLSKQLTFNLLEAQATGISKISLHIIIRIKLIRGNNLSPSYLKSINMQTITIYSIKNTLEKSFFSWFANYIQALLTLYFQVNN